MDVIDLSVGDPDLPTPEHIVKAMNKVTSDPSNHQYPSYEGKLAFRTAVADWYKRTFDVNLDPKKEVLTLIGSKEGIAHAPLAFLNPGDVALVPDPAYPVYRTATVFAGGEPVIMPLLRENKFLPDLEKYNRYRAMPGGPRSSFSLTTPTIPSVPRRTGASSRR